MGPTAPFPVVRKSSPDRLREAKLAIPPVPLLESNCTSELKGPQSKSRGWRQQIVDDIRFNCSRNGQL